MDGLTPSRLHIDIPAVGVIVLIEEVRERARAGRRHTEYTKDVA